MPMGEITILTEGSRSLLDRKIAAGTDFMDVMPKERQKMSTPEYLAEAPHGQVAVHPASRYFETREAWTVSYEGEGIRANGQVLGFSEAGWHIVGEAPVQAGARLTLCVHRPDRARFCVPSATVQGVQGRAFVIRVQL